jgi:uracil-xanthine permease
MEMVTQETKISTSKLLLLGIQHVLAMFGATVLVPALTGLNPAVALFTAGVGTIIFHLVTGRKVPVFLGSSFAFIPVILLVGETYGLPYATGGIVIAGALYLVLAGLVMVFGVERVKSFFPPIVTGPMIMVIGLTLAPTIVTNNIVAETLPGTLAQRWIIALSVLAVMIIVSVFAKGFFKLVPILFGIATGYILSLIFGGGIVNLEPVAKAKWLAFPDFMAPRFGIEAITLIAPVALVTFMEHIGDITTNGAVIGKNLMKDPGLHRTLLGDGLATMFAGLVGGPANTTYSENTGAAEVTLLNYYDVNNAMITIPLDSTKTPAQNAQYYYKLYNKAQRVLKNQSRLIKETQDELDYLESISQHLSMSTHADEVSEIREELVRGGYIREQSKNRGVKKQSLLSKPHRFLSSDGFEILVGKNNIQNDQLTLKNARSNDLWLHTKNIHGSHVIVRTEGKPVPNTTILEAANLAAYYSKGHSSANVPVDYCLRKNVKKPGGAKPGMVIYEQHKTIYVSPSEAMVSSMDRL